MSFAITDSIPARIGAAAWLVVPIAWSISVVLDRTRQWEGLPQVFWMVGAAALVAAGAMQLVVVLRATRPIRGTATRAGIAIVGLGFAVSIAVGWAVLLWLALYAVGMLMVGVRIGNRVAEAFARRGHEQQFLDNRLVAPGKRQSTGIDIGNQATLIQFHCPGDSTAGACRVQAKIVEDVVEPQHVLRPLDADIGTELSERDVFRPIALVVPVEHAVAVDAAIGFVMRL